MASSTSGLMALDDKTLAQFQKMGLTDQQLSQANIAARAEIDATQRKLSFTIPSPITSGKENLRLLLLGKTGAGKSSTGNLILGRTAFEESMHSDSCTRTIQLGECVIDGVLIQVIDTPGFNDTQVSQDHVLTEIAKVADIYKDGIDGVLFMFNLGNPRFTKEEKDSFLSIQKGLLGGELISHCFVVLSHGNQIVTNKSSLRQYLNDEVDRRTDFGEVLNKTLNGRVIAVDNSDCTEYGRIQQRQRLVRMVAAHSTKPCTPDAFKQFLRNKRKATAVPEGYWDYIPQLEHAAAQEFIDKPRHKIQHLSGREIQEIANRVAAVSKGSENDPQVQSAASTVVNSTIDSYIDNELLGMLGRFGKLLLGAAGQVVKGIFGFPI